MSGCLMGRLGFDRPWWIAVEVMWGALFSSLEIEKVGTE